MEIGNALNTGVQGFQDATARASKAAQEIASQTVTDSSQDSISTEDLTTSLVDLKVAERDAQANLKVVETASDLIGNLLNVST